MYRLLNIKQNVLLNCVVEQSCTMKYNTNNHNHPHKYGGYGVIESSNSKLQHKNYTSDYI